MGEQEEAPLWSASEQAWLATDAQSGEDEYLPEVSPRRRMFIRVANSVSVLCVIALGLMAVAVWRGPPTPAAPPVVSAPAPAAPPPVIALAEPVIELEPELVERQPPPPVRKPRSRSRSKRSLPAASVMRSKLEAVKAVAPGIKPAAPEPAAPRPAAPTTRKARYGHF